MRKLKSNEVMTITLSDFAPRIIRLPKRVELTWPHGAWVTLTREGDGYRLTWATGEQFLQVNSNNAFICPGCGDTATKIFFTGDGWGCNVCSGILHVKPIRAIPDVDDALAVSEVIKTLKHLL